MKAMKKFIAVLVIVTVGVAAAPAAAHADVDYDAVTALRNRATLHVVGSGWTPGQVVTIRQEASVPGGDIYIRTLGQLTVVADSGGNVATDFVVKKRFNARCLGLQGCSGVDGSMRQLNCAVHTCYVTTYPYPAGGTRGFAFMWSDF